MNKLRTISLMITLVATLATLVGCGYNSQKAIAENDIKLTNSYWKLIAIDGVQVNSLSNENEAYFILNPDKTITGFGSCNNFNGTWSLDDGHLTVGPLVSTKMACDKMDVEAHFLAALDGNVTTNLNDVTLTITDHDGIELKFLALSHR